MWPSSVVFGLMWSIGAVWVVSGVSSTGKLQGLGASVVAERENLHGVRGGTRNIGTNFIDSISGTWEKVLEDYRSKERKR